MVVIRQLRLLIWKNWLLQIRRPIGSAAEVLLPILLMIAFAALRQLTKPVDKCFETCGDANMMGNAANIRLLATPNSNSRTANTVLYFPENPVTRRIMETAQCLSYQPGKTPFMVMAAASVAAVEAGILDLPGVSLGGVVFNNMTTSAGTMLPPKLSYTLRLVTSNSGKESGSASSKIGTWLTALRVPTFADPGIIEPLNHDGLTKPLMYVIDQAFTRIQVDHALAGATGQSKPLCAEANFCRGPAVLDVQGIPLPRTNITCKIRDVSGSFFSNAPGATCCELDVADPTKRRCSCSRVTAPLSPTPTGQQLYPTSTGAVVGSSLRCTCTLIGLNSSCTCDIAGIVAECSSPLLGYTVGLNRQCCGLCNSTVTRIMSGQLAPSAVASFVPVFTRNMPTKEYTVENFIIIASTIFPILLVLVFSYTVYTVTQELIKEKKARLKESLRMMGCRNWVIWLSWFLKYFVQFLVIALVISAIMQVGKILTTASFGVIFLLFLLYLVAMLMNCAFWSTVFSNPIIGALTATVVFLIGVVPAFIFPGATTTDVSIKAGFCAPFFLNTCATYSLILLLQQSSRGVAITISNVDQGLDQLNTFNLQQAYLLIIAQIVAFGIMTWYIEAVFPGEYGVPKPFYFFLQSSYWFDTPSERADDYELDLLKGSEKEPDGTAFEAEPTGVRFGIQIDNLQKVFRGRGGTKLAVDGLTLNLVEGQITSLLGHNGAGKTTTMSMLTGLYNPTGGDAFINGKSILTDMDQIRGDLGLCPQHNVLWDKLTVREHLVLFGSLKGLSSTLLDMAVGDMLDDLKLRDKTTWKSMALSGGMKRKLSVGIALIGGSKVVIFDEPTAGMDPYARRATWDLLIKHKKDRTILLTTHYMDEADLLGDRIAIMADGQCKCVGSSLFLKSRYGVGYHLTVAKAPQCDESAVTEFILQAIPTGRLASSVGQEMAFILPSDATSSFAELFEAMENSKQALGIENFGLSVTTMEEVFIRVGQLAEEEKEEEKKKESRDEALDSRSKAGLAVSDIVLLTGPALWFQRLYALLLKRFTIVFRSYFVIGIQFIIPLLSLIGGFALINAGSSSSSEPGIQLGMSYFRGGAARSLTIRVADFRRPDERSVDVSDGVERYARFERVSSSDLTNTVNATLATVASSQDCCSSRYLILNQQCLTMLQENPMFCNINDNFAYKRCTSCIFKTETSSTFSSSVSAPSINSASTRLGSRQQGTSTSDQAALTFNSAYFGTCGGREGKCPASPYDIQASYTGYLQQYFLETGSLSRMDQDSTPAAITLHTMRANDTEAYNVYNLHQRDTPADCLGTTSSFVRSSAENIYSTRANTLFCEQLAASSVGSQYYARVWSWGQDYHSGPAALNTFSNAYLEAILRTRSSTQNWQTGAYSISAELLPVTPAADAAAKVAAASSTPTFSLVFGIGMSFMLASFVIFPLEEKKNKAKHIQFVSGVGPVSYWLSNFIADVVTYVLVWALMLIATAGFGSTSPTIKAITGDVALILFVGGVASISFAYFVSLAFKSPILAFAAVGILLFILTLSASLAAYVLELTGDLSTGKAIKIACSLLPPFAMSNAVSSLHQNEQLAELCRDRVELLNVSAALQPMYLDSCYNISKYTTATQGYEDKGIGYNLVMSYAVAIVLLVLVIIIEQGWLGRLFASCCTAGKPSQSTNDEDEDVAAERRKVHGMDPKKEKTALVARDLTKSFRGKLSRPSSDHICLSVPDGECFGLLGVNGAGKTTTFSMLTGEVRPTDGDAFIMGYSIRNQLSEVQQRVGYCPQFDALIEKMTSYELLTLFARLRGIPSSKVKSVVDNLVEELDLKKWASRLCGTYSGGNKRKLSTAIALVGNPPLIFLDEPTAGMDPAARRFLWDFLTKILNSGRSIVMTSHSMEECEALCTRLAIMVNGQFKCLGSLQHIKTKFGKGFNLTAKVQPPDSGDLGSDTSPDTGPLKALVATNFPSHEIEEEHYGQVQFRINQQDGDGVTWSTIFRVMEQNREALKIIDYQLSQTTLEQVFLKFAKKQSGDDS